MTLDRVLAVLAHLLQQRADAEVDTATDTAAADTAADTAAADTAPTGDTGGLGGVLAMDQERTWSPPSTLSQHHATVAVLEDGSSAVAWTEGHLGESEGFRSWIAGVDAGGVPSTPTLLVEGRDVGKPDVVADGPGGVVSASQGFDDGLWFERTELATGPVTVAPLAGEEECGGNNSVDLARRSDGSFVAVWYVEAALNATYRLQSFDADFQPDSRLPSTITTVADRFEATPDVALNDRDEVGVVWNAMSDGLLRPVDLVLDVYVDGALTVRQSVVSARNPYASPQRPTVVAMNDGWAVAWRERGRQMTPCATWFVQLDAAGLPIGAPLQPEAGNTDELVIDRVDDDHVWLAWTRVEHPDGTGTTRGGLYDLTTRRWTVAPTSLSLSDTAARPHTAVGTVGPGAYTVAVSWEELQPGSVSVYEVHGRTLHLSL